MKNEIMIQGTQIVQGKEIKSIAGGFGENKKCILASDIATMHGIENPNDINKLINKNLERFNENDLVDFLNDQQSLRDFAKENGLITNNRTKNIFLLSERGYTKLVSMMSNTNEKKWQVMDRLIDEYFTMREIINSDEQLKANLLLDLYNGGIDAVVASKKMSEIENKELTKLIEEQKPKVDYCDKTLKSEGLLTATQVAKDLGMSAREMNMRLNDKGIIYRDSSGCWIPYKNYQFLIPEYADYEVFTGVNRTTQNFKWKEKGRKFLVEEVFANDNTYKERKFKKNSKKLFVL